MDFFLTMIPLTALLFHWNIVGTTTAFSLAQNQILFTQDRSGWSQPRPQQQLPPLFAIVYGEDGNILPEEDTEDSLGPQGEVDHHLRDALMVQLDPSLVQRIACTMLPSSSSFHDDVIHPSQLESAIIVSASQSKLEVALSIPQDGTSGTCVQVLVPIPLLPSNNDKSTDEIVENIIAQLQEYDSKAIQKIEEMERREDQHEALAAESALLGQLEEEPYADDLPDWWTFPELKLTLADECSHLKRLLNEDDFMEDLQQLYQKFDSSSKEIRQIETVRVAAVGPSGLFLRGLLSTGKDKAIVEVPISFGEEALTADDLRDQVLDMIENIGEPLPTEELPLSTTAVSTSTEAPTLTIQVEDEVETGTTDSMIAMIAEARKQPKEPTEEAKLAAKYGAIDDLGERAFVILKDLYMI